MIFEYLVPQPFELGDVRKEHDKRVFDIAVGDVTTLFCPQKIKKGWTYSLPHFTKENFLLQHPKYQLVRFSDNKPACAVEITSMSVTTPAEVTEAEIAGSGGPEDLHQWCEWLRTSWKSPMNAKLLGKVKWSAHMPMIRVEVKVVDTFTENSLPLVPSTSIQESLNTLFDGLLTRPTPAMVMETILQTSPPPPPELRVLAFEQLHSSGSLMPTNFAALPNLSWQLATARRMVAKFPGLPAAPASAVDAEKLVAWVETCLTGLGFEKVTPSGRRHAQAGHRSGKRADIRQRWNREQLARHYPSVSVNQYRKTVRTLVHLHKRALVARDAADYARCIRLGKTRLAAHIDRDEFLTSPATAQFVAYYLARIKLRTLFTTDSQDRAMDEAADWLLQRALSDPSFNPELMAKVYNPPHIIAKLDDAAKLRLLNFYFSELTWLATQLKKLWKPQWRGENMVMRKGDDSSAWNAAARAWDQMRTGWLNVVVGAGWADILKDSTFGKVSSLVAGDVAYLHHLEGSHDAHPDVRVFQQLPLPWDVVLGEATCTEVMVRETCAQVGIDPDDTGWTKPYRQKELAVTRPTYDLVHGIEVANPVLATVLRKAGWWSGKN